MGWELGMLLGRKHDRRGWDRRPARGCFGGIVVGVGRVVGVDTAVGM